MRFCCRAFEQWHGLAGTRGFGALSEASELRLSWVQDDETARIANKDALEEHRWK